MVERAKNIIPDRPQPSPSISGGATAPPKITGTPAPGLQDASGNYPVNPYKTQLDAFRQLYETSGVRLEDGEFPGTGVKVGDVAKNISPESILSDVVEVPGVSSPTSFTALVNELYNLDSRDVRALQRNLVAAGYATEETFKTVGWPDHATQQAYSYLLQEAIATNIRPDQLLRFRSLVRGGMDAAEARKMLKSGDIGEEEHLRHLEDVYVKAWKRKPPPKYVEKFVEFNPEEFEHYERNKEAWQSSRSSIEARGNLESALEIWFRQGRE